MMSDTADPAPASQLSGFSLSSLPSTRCTFGSAGPRGGIDLRGAAGDDDARLGTFAGDAADRLARLALGLGGDGAGVDDDGVGLGGRAADSPRITSLS